MIKIHISRSFTFFCFFKEVVCMILRLSVFLRSFDLLLIFIYISLCLAIPSWICKCFWRFTCLSLLYVYKGDTSVCIILYVCMVHMYWAWHPRNSHNLRSYMCKALLRFLMPVYIFVLMVIRSVCFKAYTVAKSEYELYSAYNCYCTCNS